MTSLGGIIIKNDVQVKIIISEIVTLIISCVCILKCTVYIPLLYVYPKRSCEIHEREIICENGQTTVLIPKSVQSQWHLYDPECHTYVHCVETGAHQLGEVNDITVATTD